MQHRTQSDLEQAGFTSSASMFKGPEGRVFGFGTTVGNGIEGWAPNAIFVDTDASTGSALYTNTGSKTTASWTVITDTFPTSGFLMASGLADMAGIADVLVLDDDGDTTISAPTDDQIDIEVGGSDVGVIYLEGIQDHGNEAITATVGGGAAGLISQGTKLATATSDTATKQISLPAATIGDIINILVKGAACELISAVAGHKVNNVVVGATNELALVEDSLYRCHYVGTNNWIVTGVTKLGADEGALVPDSV